MTFDLSKWCVVGEELKRYDVLSLQMVCDGRRVKAL